jgi:hypothetical protein
MNKSRKEVIDRLKWSQDSLIKDLEKGKFFLESYALTPKTFALNEWEKKELVKMENEGLLVQITDFEYVPTKQGRKELLGM